MTDLFQARLVDLGMDLILKTIGVDICLTKIKIGLEEGNRSVLKIDIKNESTHIIPLTS